MSRGLIVGMAIGGVHQEAEGLQMIGASLRVHRNHREAAALFVGSTITMLLAGYLGIADGMDIDFIPEAVLVLAGIRQAVGGPVAVRPADFVGSPPSGIAYRDGWGAKRPDAVAVAVDTILHQGSQVLIAVDMQSHRALECS